MLINKKGALIRFLAVDIIETIKTLKSPRNEVITLLKNKLI